MSKTERLPFSSASLSPLGKNSTAIRELDGRGRKHMADCETSRSSAAPAKPSRGQGGQQTVNPEQGTEFDSTRELLKPMAS